MEATTDVSESVEVSVVIPTHRGGDLLRQSVSSALDQTMSKLEVVVVSDGCPDDLSDLTGIDPRVRVLDRPHAGVSVARNIGLTESTGELVAFLDEDDLARPERLERQLDAMEKRPASAMCHGAFEIIDRSGKVLVERRGEPYQYQDMLELGFPLLSTLMVRRSHVAKIGGFDPALVLGEDIDFCLRSAMLTEVAFVSDVVTSYRRHGSNTATGVWDVYPFILKHRRWAELNGRHELVAAADKGLRKNRRNAARAAFNDARVARRDGKFGEMARWLAVSLARDPTLVPGVALSRLSTLSHQGAQPYGAAPIVGRRKRRRP